MKKIRLFALLVVAAVLLCSCNGAVTVLSPSSSSVSSSPSVSSETSFPSDPTTNTEKPSPTTPSSTPTDPSSPSKDSPSSTVDPSSPSTSLPPKEEYTPFVPEEKVVAFTFDDGPDYWTRFILDVIDGTEDKLTFFVTYQAKSWLDGTIYEDSLRRAHSLGCEIGIHSKNHAYVYTASTGTDASAEVLQTELYDFAEIIAGITGEKPKIFRPVGGSFNTQKDYGYPAILWSVDSQDWIISAKYWNEGLKNHQIQDRNEEVRKVVEKATKELVDHVVSTVKSGDIVLMHDVHFLSKNAFPEIYRQLKEQGYRFVTVSELLNIDPTEQNGCYFFSTSEYGKDGMLYRLTDTGIVSEQFAVKPSKVY